MTHFECGGKVLRTHAVFCFSLLLPAAVNFVQEATMIGGHMSYFLNLSLRCLKGKVSLSAINVGQFNLIWGKWSSKYWNCMQHLCNVPCYYRELINCTVRYTRKNCIYIYVYSKPSTFSLSVWKLNAHWLSILNTLLWFMINIIIFSTKALIKLFVSGHNIYGIFPTSISHHYLCLLTLFFICSLSYVLISVHVRDF